MKVSEIGQFGLIDIVAKMIESSRDNQADSWKNLLVGIGDDCAVWRGEAVNQLAKVDCQVQGIHFDLGMISWEDLGWKSLAVNLSDIAAMGGLPRYALVSLGLPRDTEVENVVSLYKGMLELAKLTGTAIVGGNISGSPTIFVDVNVMGIVGNPKGKYLSRAAAKPGDRIAVTGWLGTAAAGLKMLTRKINFDRPDRDCLKQAFARPEPRLAEGCLLVEKGVRCCIDISDGLVADLGHICQESAVGSIIYCEKLPVRSEVQKAFGKKSLNMALSGGEDYQLLFTARPAVIERVSQSSACPVTVIGEIIAEDTGKVIVVDAKGGRFYPEIAGWDHFKMGKKQSRIENNEINHN
jgi:thiamine-monophosphate kinase